MKGYFFIYCKNRKVNCLKVFYLLDRAYKIYEEENRLNDNLYISPFYLNHSACLSSIINMMCEDNEVELNDYTREEYTCDNGLLRLRDD